MVVDRRPLVAGRHPGHHRLRRHADARRLAACCRAHRRRLLHLRQAPVLLPADRPDADAGDFARLAAPYPAAGAAGVLRQRRAAGRHLRHRHRDQGRAALDLGARPVEPAALGVRQAEPGGDLGLAAGAEPRRTAGAGLHPLDPAGRRRAGAAGDAARPRHERGGGAGMGRPALRRRPADVGRGLRRGRRRRRAGRRLLHLPPRAQPLRPLPRSLVGRQLPGQHLARSLHERRRCSAAARARARSRRSFPTPIPTSSWRWRARSSAWSSA